MNKKKATPLSHPGTALYNEKLSLVFDAFSLFSLVLWGFMGFLVGFLL
jgi:hypothetical protein